jgi:hypothetical protein
VLYLIVFTPVIVGIAALFALLLGAATAGTWEAVEERREANRTAAGQIRPQASPRPATRARAA